jgi:polyhydroxybutyrate depolymerase
MRSAGCGSTQYSPGTTVDQIETAAGERAYRLHVPAGYNPRRATPLVLNFHGYAQDAEQQEAYSGLVPLSDAKGFILVTPEGSGDPKGWDIVGLYAEDGVDDVQFVADLVSHLSDVLCLNENRIFATGHSNGAEMASQVACDIPGLLAAEGPVAGPVYQGCNGPGVPMIAFQGTDDWNVPYSDTADAVQQWAVHNSCTGMLAPTPTSDHVSTEVWSGCSGGDVILYTIDGGGHTWPGANPDLGGVGVTTDEINASQLMWQFFQAHPKK